MNLKFKIHSDIAWVTYEDILYNKVNGEWKIFFTSLVHLTSYDEEILDAE